MTAGAGPASALVSSGPTAWMTLTRIRARAARSLLGAVLALSSGACDVTEPGKPAPTDPTAEAGQGGAPATAGASGSTSAGAMSTAGQAGRVPQQAYTPPVPPAPPVQCGPTLCPAPDNIASELLTDVVGLPSVVPDAVACCLDGAAGGCGSAAAIGGTCEPLASPDDRCPGIDLSALAALIGGLGKGANYMVGCCTREGACGSDGRLFGRGCVENDEVKRMLGSVPVIGPLITFPPVQPCAAGGSGESGPDAGI